MESLPTKQFVIISHSINDAIKEGHLIDTDLVIYASLRKYMDKTKLTSDSSYSQISKISGASIPTIKTSINRLESCGFISVTQRMNKSNIYKFAPITDNFEMFLFDLLDNLELDLQEKAFVIAIRRFLFEREGSLFLVATQEQLAEMSGLSKMTVRRRLTSLLSKSKITYILKPHVNNGNDKFELAFNPKAFGLVLAKQQERLEEHDDEIRILKEKVKFLEEQLSRFTNELRVG